MTPHFDHEKLEAYCESIAFCGRVGDFLASIQSKISARDQLGRASTSVPLNIAEGNGKFSARDRVRFLEMARGSALECAACLDVLVARKLTNADQANEAKSRRASIVRMLMGLLKRFSERADVLKEEEGDSADRRDQEQDQAHEREEKQ